MKLHIFEYNYLYYCKYSEINLHAGNTEDTVFNCVYYQIMYAKFKPSFSTCRHPISYIAKGNLIIINMYYSKIILLIFTATAS